MKQQEWSKWKTNNEWNNEKQITNEIMRDKQRMKQWETNTNETMGDIDKFYNQIEDWVSMVRMFWF